MRDKTQASQGAKDKPNGPTLARRIWLFAFDPVLDEMRLWLKLTSLALFVGCSCALVVWLERKGFGSHLIDYIGIALADLTAGALLFILLERRISGKEIRFADERNLGFAVNRVVFSMTLFSKNLVNPVHFTTDVENSEIATEMQQMLGDPEQWRFYGSEMLHGSLDNFIRNNSNDDPKAGAEKALRVVSHALGLSASSYIDRMRISRSAVLVAQPVMAGSLKRGIDQIIEKSASTNKN